MPFKAWITSKVFWWNTISLVLGILAIPEVSSLIPTKYLPTIVIINAIGNYILRKLTVQPIGGVFRPKKF